MAPYLKKLPVIAMGALCICLIVAACETGERAASISDGVPVSIFAHG